MNFEYPFQVSDIAKEIAKENDKMKIGALVRNHIAKIQTYCESNPNESLHLMDAAYSRKIFNLNWPFFAKAERIPPIDHVRYWTDRYIIGDKRSRVCSQWFARDREAFNRYLRAKDIGNGEPTDPAMSVGSPSPPSPPRNNRYKATAIGDAQNLLVRVILQRADRQYEESATFEFGDEEDLATRADRLEIGGLVEGAVDRDGGFFFEVMAQARVELVHRLDDAAQVSGFDLKFAHAAGVAPAEAGGEDYACGHRLAPVYGGPSPPTPPP